MPSRATVPGSSGTGDTIGTPWHKADIDKFPGGCVAYTAITSDVTITTTNDIASITWAAYASRFYDIEAEIACRSTAGGDQIRCLITDASNVPLAEEELTTVAANQFITFRVSLRCQNPGATTVIYKLRGLRSNGSGTCTAEPTAFSGLNVASLIARDTGPSF